MMDALEKEYVSSSFDSQEASPISPLTIKSHRVVELEDTSETSDVRAVYSRAASQRPAISSNWPRHVSTSSESMMSGQSDGSTYGVNTSTLPLTSAKRSMSPSMVNHARADSLFTDSRTTPLKQIEDPMEYQRSNTERSETPLDSSQTDVKEAVEDAMQELQQVRLREQSLRPLRFEPQDKFHKPDADINQAFERSAYGELKVRRLNTRDWLLVAVWWLLKILSIFSICVTY